jgi:hypothetical protein
VEEAQMSERGVTKLSPRLRQALGAIDESSQVEVIVEMQPVEVSKAGSRQDRVAAMKEDFERDVRPMAEKIIEAGGEVLETAWLNQTLRSRLPARKVSQVAEHETVRSIDLPHELEPEGQSPTQTRPDP